MLPEMSSWESCSFGDRLVVSSIRVVVYWVFVAHEHGGRTRTVHVTVKRD